MEWPEYEFAHYVGPSFRWFAWYPVRLWYGKRVWLCWVSVRLCSKHNYLDGPDWQFWVYNVRKSVNRHVPPRRWCPGCDGWDCEEYCAYPGTVYGR